MLDITTSCLIWPLHFAFSGITCSFTSAPAPLLRHLLTVQSVHFIAWLLEITCRSKPPSLFTNLRDHVVLPIFNVLRPMRASLIVSFRQLLTRENSEISKNTRPKSQMVWGRWAQSAEYKPGETPYWNSKTPIIGMLKWDDGQKRQEKKDGWICWFSSEYYLSL